MVMGVDHDPIAGAYPSRDGSDLQTGQRQVRPIHRGIVRWFVATSAPYGGVANPVPVNWGARAVVPCIAPKLMPANPQVIR